MSVDRSLLEDVLSNSHFTSTEGLHFKADKRDDELLQDVKS